MEYSDLLSRLEVFFSEVGYNHLLKAVQNRMAIVIDFSDIEKFDVDVADTLFESPTESSRLLTRQSGMWMSGRRSSHRFR